MICNFFFCKKNLFSDIKQYWIYDNFMYSLSKQWPYIFLSQVCSSLCTAVESLMTVSYSLTFFSYIRNINRVNFCRQIMWLPLCDSVTLWPCGFFYSYRINGLVKQWATFLFLFRCHISGNHPFKLCPASKADQDPDYLEQRCFSCRSLNARLNCNWPFFCFL